MPSILFIGAGRMAEAIFAGLLEQPKQTFNPVYVSNQTNRQHLKKLEHDYDIETVSDWEEVAQKVDVILLAAPPSAHPQLLQQLSPLISGQLIITVAAGIGTSDMEAQLPKGTATAWIMPNTAAQAGVSMSLYTVGAHATAAHKQFVLNLVHAIGEAEELTEAQIHELTAITGSAPAFVYEFALQLQSIAKSYGITDAQAKKLVTAMFDGSAQMLKSELTAAELRDQVTTPGGATDAGLKSLNRDEFQASIARAVSAVTDHAKKKRN
ncbi:pyrroline-5-carboxylate reductase [Shouchella patagoniensis]|uniref:pyrroline-5-carboxylate reductase n=1 Tax=Shouchella patagoniensis TaxID=228576 RepID=UPI00099520EF|nr:pyrroline-5-carboxylate reductase [Shouchella patagoniensis]